MRHITDVNQINIPSKDFLLYLSKEEAQVLCDALYKHIPKDKLKTDTKLMATIVALESIASQ